MLFMCITFTAVSDENVGEYPYIRSDHTGELCLSCTACIVCDLQPCHNITFIDDVHLYEYAYTPRVCAGMGASV